MNLTDEAMTLLQRLAVKDFHESEPSQRLGRIRYRAYLRWKRRNARELGLIPPKSLWALRQGLALEAARRA